MPFSFSAIRLHPRNSRPAPAKCVPLSILDATVVSFTTSAAVWFYRPETVAKSSVSSSDLRLSLEATLDSCPHLAGKLHWAAFDPTLGHSHRYRRLEISYGTETDPGVDFVTAQSSLDFIEVVPHLRDRRQDRGLAWDCASQPSEYLLSCTPLALCGSELFEGLPCLKVQITTFRDGGVAISVAFSHPMADATSLSHFVHGWASMTRAMMDGEALSEIPSIFDPQRLDSMAAGNIDGVFADASITAAARALPLHRYDQGLPKGSESLQPPLTNLSPAVPKPSGEWDVTAPVSRRLIHFSRSEIDRLWACANDTENSFFDQGLSISRHDALVGHIWMLINRARLLQHDTAPVYLDYTFGFRTRLSPPLPPSFYGSPLMNAAVKATGKELCQQDALPTIARIVRSTMAKFDIDTIPLLLHDAAFEALPQRLWQAFLGNRHVLLTTWAHTHLYHVDLLHTGHAAEYVESIMPRCDGLVQIMEACPSDQLVSDNHLQESWYKHGADVMINLTEEAMERLLVDPL